MTFSGTMTALITPFNKGEIDFPSLKQLIKHQMENGIEGFIVSGSTAEAATLDLEEKKKILDFIVAEVGRQVPVIMGSGTFNTQETADLTRVFEKLKPDGFLIVTPYYNRPPQRGLVAHFKEAAAATELPIIIYNVPSRTACTIAPETVAEIAKKSGNVVGIKEAGGSIEIITQLRKVCAPDFSILSGDDGTFIEAVDAGGNGVISVISHVIPRWCVEASKKAMQHKDVKPLTAKVKNMATILFCESNPIPVKWALKQMGIITSAELRLPLMELGPSYQPQVKACLQEWGVL